MFNFDSISSCNTDTLQVPHIHTARKLRLIPHPSEAREACRNHDRTITSLIFFDKCPFIHRRLHTNLFYGRLKTWQRAITWIPGNAVQGSLFWIRTIKTYPRLWQASYKRSLKVNQAHLTFVLLPTYLRSRIKQPLCFFFLSWHLLLHFLPPTLAISLRSFAEPMPVTPVSQQPSVSPFILLTMHASGPLPWNSLSPFRRHSNLTLNRSAPFHFQSLTGLSPLLQSWARLSSVVNVNWPALAAHSWNTLSPLHPALSLDRKRCHRTSTLPPAGPCPPSRPTQMSHRSYQKVLQLLATPMTITIWFFVLQLKAANLYGLWWSFHLSWTYLLLQTTIRTSRYRISRDHWAGFLISQA